MKKRNRRIVPVTAAALVLLCWFGNRTVGVHEYELRSSRIPAAFDGYRIALLTDLHGQSLGPDNARLLRQVKKAAPDIIALGGDIVDERTDLSMLRPLLESLTAIAPVYYVPGNHEWKCDKPRQIMEIFEECGVTRFISDFTALEKDGAQIVLAGKDDPNSLEQRLTFQKLVKNIRKEYPEEYVLMLYHRNDQLDSLAELGVDAVLSGHAHGGIIRLPVLGPLFGTHYNWFPEDVQGLVERGGAAMLVSRGLGPSHRLPIRIFNRPEIPVAVLRCGEE